MVRVSVELRRFYSKNEGNSQTCHSEEGKARRENSMEESADFIWGIAMVAMRLHNAERIKAPTQV